MFLSLWHLSVAVIYDVQCSEVFFTARNLPEERTLRMKRSTFSVGLLDILESGIFYFSLQKKRSKMFKSSAYSLSWGDFSTPAL